MGKSRVSCFLTHEVPYNVNNLVYLSRLNWNAEVNFAGQESYPVQYLLVKHIKHKFISKIIQNGDSIGSK